LLFFHLPVIFDKFNRLNSSLRDPSRTLFQVFDKVSAFIKKVMLWKILCGGEIWEIFLHMSEYLEEHDYIV
jgi:hypothetical protein